MAFFARNLSVVLLFAGVAHAAITNSSVIQRGNNTNEVVLVGTVTTNTATAGVCTVTVPAANFTATATTTSNATVIVESLTTAPAYQVDTINTAAIANDGTTVTVTFTTTVPVEVNDTFLMTLPLSYVATGGVFNVTMQGGGNTQTLPAYDSTKECTCGNGGASGFDLSATMTCSTDVTSSTDVSLLIVDDAALTAFNALNLNASVLLTHQINGVNTLDAAPFTKSTTAPYAEVTLSPVAGTTISAGSDITMSVVPDAAYNSPTTDFNISCAARAFCHAGVDVHSVGEVTFCSSANKMAGASILTVLMAGVSMLI